MLDRVKSYLAKPYSDDMSVVDWFLFLGLLIVLMTIWRIILYHLKEALE